MGWLYSSEWKTKAEIVQHLLTGYPSHTPIAHSCVGNHLWIVYEGQPDGDKAGERVLALCLLASHGNHGWGYKDMTESMGPYESDCPLKYLDMVPDPGGYATAFRERVRAFHDAKRAKKSLMSGLRPGVRVQFVEGCKPQSAVVDRLNPLVVVDDNGARYRVRPRHIQGVIG